MRSEIPWCLPAADLDPTKRAREVARERRRWQRHQPSGRMQLLPIFPNTPLRLRLAAWLELLGDTSSATALLDTLSNAEPQAVVKFDNDLVDRLLDVVISRIGSFPPPWNEDVPPVPVDVATSLHVLAGEILAETNTSASEEESDEPDLQVVLQQLLEFLWQMSVVREPLRVGVR